MGAARGWLGLCSQPPQPDSCQVCAKRAQQRVAVADGLMGDGASPMGAARHRAKLAGVHLLSEPTPASRSASHSCAFNRARPARRREPPQAEHTGTGTAGKDTQTALLTITHQGRMMGRAGCFHSFHLLFCSLAVALAAGSCYLSLARWSAWLHGSCPAAICRMHHAWRLHVVSPLFPVHAHVCWVAGLWGW